MEVPEIFNEPGEEGGGETGSDEPSIEVNEEKINEVTQKFEQANQDAAESGSQEAINEARTNYLNTVNVDVRSALEKTIPEADKASFNKAYDAISDTLQKLEIDPSADTVEQLKNVYDEAITDLKDKLTKDNTLQKGLKAISNKFTSVKDAAVKNIKKVFGDSVNKQAEVLRNRITEVYSDAAKEGGNPSKEELSELNKKITDLQNQMLESPELDQKVNEMKPGADEKTKKSLKEKIVKGLTIALGISTIGGLIFLYIQYSNSNPQCYLLTGGPSGLNPKTPVTISSSKCNCNIPNNKTPTPCTNTSTGCIKGQFYIKCDASDRNNYACCAEEGLTCSPISVNSGATYTYTPNSFGGFIKNVMDGALSPASNIFNNIFDKIGNMLKSLAGPIKVIIIVLVVGFLLAAGVKIYYMFKPQPQLQYPPQLQYAPQPRYPPQPQYAPQPPQMQSQPYPRS